MLAVGEYLLGNTPVWDGCRKTLMRASCPFGGGLVDGQEELCGVLSGAALVLGAAYGRVSPTESDDALYAFLRAYRQRFRALHGTTQCRPIRDRLPEGHRRCHLVVVQGVGLLMQMLEESPLGPSRA